MSEPLGIRRRDPADVPALARLLAEQRDGSSYPVRWPLPFPTEDFVARPYDRAAWVAHLGDEVVGHVSVGSTSDLRARLTAATGATSFGMVQALFTGLGVRGRGVGGRLLDVAVAWIRERGELPVLDVVPVHAAALALYERRGWVEIGRDRFDWMAGLDVPDVRLMALPPYPLLPLTHPDLAGPDRPPADPPARPQLGSPRQI